MIRFIKDEKRWFRVLLRGVFRLMQQISIASRRRIIHRHNDLGSRSNLFEGWKVVGLKSEVSDGERTADLRQLMESSYKEAKNRL